MEPPFIFLSYKQEKNVYTIIIADSVGIVKVFFFPFFIFRILLFADFFFRHSWVPEHASERGT